jgi:hypothetical protein
MTSTMTLAEMITLTGKDVLDYLDRDVAVPTVTAAACQGDVGVFRDDALPPSTAPMPAAVVVVRSEASSNTHSLHPDGACFWEPNPSSSVTDLTLGVLTVPSGSRAFLSHPEHGGLVILPGTYRVGRQREFAGEWAFVAD